MNIGIDARLLECKMGGIVRYLHNVVNAIPKYDNKNNYFLYAYDDIKYKNDYYNIIVTHKNKLPRQVFGHYWLNFILPKKMAEQKIDLFYSPYLFVPFKKGKIKNAIVIYDSMPVTCKDFFPYHYRKYIEFLLPKSIKRGDAIITISNSAKEDIIKYYNAAPEKVHYTYLWADDKFQQREFKDEEKKELLSKLNLPEKFILYVGVIEKRKNILGILKISDILKSKGINIKLVLIGRAGFGFKDIYKEIKKREDRIIYLNHVSEQNLQLYYNLAAIFLFPSHYEGFGLPPLEAMKSGLPVLSSNNSSLIEVVGEGGLLNNSNDYESFVKNIISLINDKDFYLLMKNNALKQASKFSSENEMSKLIKIFDSLNS